MAQAIEGRTPTPNPSGVRGFWERYSPLLVPVFAVFSALVVGALMIGLTGGDWLAAYIGLWQGSFGSPQAIAATLVRSTPYVICGLAVALAFKSGLFNIGAEGQLYAGALAAVAVGQWVADWSPWIAIPVIFVAGAVAGGLLFLVAVQLKHHLNVDEVVTTLLSNFIVVLLISLLVDGPLKDPLSMGWPQSVPVDDTLRLEPLVEGSQVTSAFLLALVMSAVVWLYNQRTVWGFEGKVLGVSPSAARFAGMPVPAVLIRVALLSGGLAGLAGVAEILGPRGFLITDLSPGYGYTGIVVATLAQLHPIAVAFIAFVVAAIYVGADSMSHTLGISNYIADVILSISLLAMLVAGFFSQYRIRRG